MSEIVLGASETWGTKMGPARPPPRPRPSPVRRRDSDARSHSCCVAKRRPLPPAVTA